MSRFDTYFFMKEPDAIEYAKEKLTDIFDKDAVLSCKEIGDGNLNYVFRVMDEKSGRSVIIKHAGPTSRTSSSALSTDRNRIESELLTLEGKLAPGFVPEVYLCDTTMSCLVMEDLRNFKVMRGALIDHETFPNFAEHISTFMVNTLLLTTDVVMDHKEKKEMVRSYINPQLCDISERLVYTEPYNDYRGANHVFAPNQAFVEKELYGDKALHLAVAKLKFEFMTNAQSLIHGDLHSGSIFVNKDETKVLDPEFACYGPMGYDVGNVIGNLFFAWANGDATMEAGAEKDAYMAWLESAISDTVDLFIAKFKKAFAENVTDYMAKSEGFLDWYLGTVLSDTAGVAGLEMIRRTVGSANVKDLTCIEDEAKRARAEKIVILAAKDFILNREGYDCGKKYIDTIHKVAASL